MRSSLFRDLKDSIINLVTSRLFVLILAFLLVSGILLYRIFDLQIVNGEGYLNDFHLKIRKERSISGTRGSIFDRNGELLAYNELAYSVTIEDVYESGDTKNEQLNATIYNLIQIIEDNHDKIVNDFNIIINSHGEYEFTLKDTQLLRFLADIYGHATIDELKYAEKTATADDVMNYLAGTNKYAIGARTDPNDKKSFVVGIGYTKADVLKMVTVRYAMSANSFQKYIPTVVATDVSDKTVAVVMESSEDLNGVSIAEDTIRKYEDSVYFSHIIGYTGKISLDEYTQLQLENPNYSLNDVIGKAGIEQVMETKLQGVKGSEIIYVDNMGKVIESSDRIEPVAGSDLHLTIDKDLQKAVYSLLEQKIAGILLLKIKNIKEYNAGPNASASDIIIPIDDVYFALINNNIIDTAHFYDEKAKETEQAVYAKYKVKYENAISYLWEELKTTKTPYEVLPKEYQVYQSYISSMLEENGIILKSEIDTSDEIYQAWRAETGSMHDYLRQAIAMNWIDVTKINLESKYADSEEIYKQLLNYIFGQLEANKNFDKKLYKYMISENTLTGREVCMLLFEQKIIDYSDNDVLTLQNGTKSAYDFILEKIKKLEITPAQLALDPYSGSCVVTDVNTGEIRALVSYPSYDSNRLANGMDASYYQSLQEDLSEPLWDYATQQKTAPGSTFKMVTSVAGLEENVITTGETIKGVGVFDKLTQPYRCWISPGQHGSLNVTGGIGHSCNYFFYETGYRLAMDGTGFNNDYGLERLAKYTDLFGLSEKSGVEIQESEPKMADDYVVPSAIGQGNSAYTTVGLARYVTTVANSGTCYNLSVLDKLTDANGNLLEDYTCEVRNTIDVASSTWSAIHRGMRDVILSKQYYNDMKVNVAGKTGTAEQIASRANHALFVGYAPYENPEIAIATRVAYGYSSNYAAEISRDVIMYYFGLEEEEELLTGVAERPDATATGGD